MTRALSAMCLLILSSSPSLADSAGTFALGEDYAVFTTFCPSVVANQCLHVVPFVTTGDLKVTDTVPVNISYSTIVLSGRQVFLRWYEKLYVYEISDDWQLKHIHTLDLPKTGTVKYPLAIENDRVYLYNESNVLTLDVSKPPSDWIPLPISDRPSEERAASQFLDYSTWSVNRSSCIEYQDTIFCLVTGSSIMPYREYRDVFLTRRDEWGNIDSLLHLYSSLRAWGKW